MREPRMEMPCPIIPAQNVMSADAIFLSTRYSGNMLVTPCSPEDGMVGRLID